MLCFTSLAVNKVLENAVGSTLESANKDRFVWRVLQSFWHPSPCSAPPHQWLETRPSRQQCPVCKAGISREKVIPLYGRGSSSQEDPRWAESSVCVCLFWLLASVCLWLFLLSQVENSTPASGAENRAWEQRRSELVYIFTLVFK